MRSSRSSRADWLARLRSRVSGARLVVLAYHRIGQAADTAYDPHLYCATADELESQLDHLSRETHVVDLEEALAIAAGRERARGVSVLITFDDGYRDAYEIAFPRLAARGLPAVFFLISDWIDRRRLAWWDEVAWIVRRAPPRTIRFGEPPAAFEIDLARRSREAAIQTLLDHFKSREGGDAERFVVEIASACEIARPAVADAEWMTWDEARVMLTAGMTFGSHTHRHPILARLSEDEQVDELERSRETIRERLGVDVDVLAYPVGGREHFTAATARALVRTGYRAAFSCYGGVNRSGATALDDVRRLYVYAGLEKAPLS